MQAIKEFEQNQADTKQSSADSPLLRYLNDRGDGFSAKGRVRGLEGQYLPCHYFDFIGGSGVGG